MVFDSMREADEWADSIYNEIGNIHDGYTTSDYKVASALVFKLAQLNAHKMTFNVRADLNYGVNPNLYRVWVTQVSAYK